MIKNIETVLKSNTFKSKIIKILPFLVFAIFITLMHWLIQGWHGDDYYYSEVLNKNSYKQFLYNNFQVHSSRLIIDGIAATVLHISMNLWKVMDIIIVSCVPVLIAKVLSIKINQNNAMMLCAVFMLFPFYWLSECGWGVTTMYYFWAVVLGVLAVSFAYKVMRQNKLKWYEIMIFFIANLFACNLELTNIILITIYSFILIYQIIKKRPYKIVLLMLFIGIGEMIFALLAPGNMVRMQSEIPHSLVDFNMLTTLDKIQIGFTTTVYAMVNNIFFALLCVLLSIYMIKKKNDVLYRIIAIVPLLVCLTLGHFESIVAVVIPGIERIANALGNYGVVSLANFDIRSAYIPIILFCITGACLLCSIIVIYPNRKGLMLDVAIIAGLLSRVAMGFSPTIYRSGKRTFIPLIMVLIICDCFLLNDMFESKVIGSRFRYIFISLACVSFICTFTYIQ